MRLSKPILSIKIRNAIQKAYPNAHLEFTLKNVIRNGVKYGSSGFVTNTDTNKHVWLSTDNECCPRNIVYRTAEHTRDYHGGFNHWCNTIDELTVGIKPMLEL